MIEVHVECDRCHKEWKEGDKDAPQLWELKVMRTCIQDMGKYATQCCVPALPNGPKVHWCRECMEAQELLPKQDALGHVPPEPDDPAKRLAELIHEVVENAIDGRA
jgi:hypothetical protein